MRHLNPTPMVVVTANLPPFVVHNLESVTVSLASNRLTLPLALLVAAVFLLGMATFSALPSPLRALIRGARRPLS